MGQTLSEPIREKHTQSDGDARHIYGASEMQGWRINMEDAHTMLLQMSPKDHNSYFAVFDGHGGSSAAKFSGEHVHKRLASEESYKKKDYTTAFKQAFLGTDDDLRSDSNFFRDPSGCTAVASLITRDDKIYVANAGDSRAVMSVGGEVKALSFDHKPQNEGENARIRAAGGFVEYGRVNGNLALSRAIGDFEFKSNTSLEPEQQIVTSDPDITVHEPTAEDEFIIIACDGIWDCLTSQQAVDITRRLIAEKKELSEISETIMDKCLAPDSDINGGVGCDNMTVAVVGLLRGRTKEQWYNWITERVEKKVGYETPQELPQLYSAARLSAAKDRWSAPNNRFGGGSFSRAGGSGFGTRLDSNVMFHPSGGMSNNATFDQDDSSEEYESEDGERDAAHEAAGNANYSGGLTAPAGKDVNQSLREQLKELKGGEDDPDLAAIEGGSHPKKWAIDDDGDASMGGEDSGLIKSTIFNRRAGKGVQPKDENDGDDTAAVNGILQEQEGKLPVGLASAPPTSIGSPLVPSHSSIQTFRSPIASKTEPELQAEAPLLPKVNGVANKSSVEPVKQLEMLPGGNNPNAGGPSDRTEDPPVATKNGN